MKIKYLGTAAAEGSPAMFCNCENCKTLRKLGGKNLRARTQAVIDDKILIDFNADTFLNFQRFGLDTSGIKHVLITHSHSDHLAPLDLEMRECAKNLTEKQMIVYGNKAVLETIINSNINLEKQNIILKELKPFEPVEFDGYKITPLQAWHQTSERSYVYVIEKDGKSMLYCNDTGLLPDEDILFLNRNKYKKFDFIGFDCTYGTTPAYTFGGHMSIYDDKVMYDRFYNNQLVDEQTKVLVTHFAHWYMLPHDEFQKLADEFNFIVAYDGIEIEF